VAKHVEVSNRTLGLYRMWHAKDPSKLIETTFDFPDVVGELGRAMRIIYWSDKWKENGSGDYYEHDFDSEPPVFCESSDYKERSVERLMQTPGLNETKSEWPILAEVCELSVRLHEGNVKTFRFKKPPLLLCTPDKKCICILYKKEPIFIRGGRMKVTARGIVN
jgi:hypothetical protein